MYKKNFAYHNELVEDSDSFDPKHKLKHKDKKAEI